MCVLNTNYWGTEQIRACLSRYAQSGWTAPITDEARMCPGRCWCSFTSKGV